LASWGVAAASRDVEGATAAGRGVAATNCSHFFYFFIFSNVSIHNMTISYLLMFLDCFSFFPIHNLTICFLLIVTNLLKRRNVVGWISTNLTNRRSVLDLNINQCTTVKKNRNTSQCSGLEYPSVHIRDEK
jgi:hypothetical protein